MKILRLGILGGVVGLAAMTAPAFGADMQLPVKAPLAPPPVYSWTGVYIGGHVGYGAASQDWRGIDFANVGGVAVPTALGSGNINGGLGGAQIGFNYQIGSVVLGAEGDISWTDITGQTCPVQNPFPGLGVPATVQCSANIKWISTATAHFGIAYDRAMFYVKGGGAWAKQATTIELNALPVVVADGTIDEIKQGYTAGAGIEFAFSRNWSARLEYDYITFGNRRTAILFPGAVAPTNFDIRERIHAVKLGINYKFDWFSPVVANY